MPCDSIAFRGWVAAEYLRAHGDVVSETTIRSVVLALTGHGLPTRDVAVRVRHEGARIGLDLGTRAISISADGIRNDDRAVFYRPSGSAVLPDPIISRSDEDARAAIEELRAALGLEPGYAWTCALAWMLAALRGEPPYPVLVIRGEQGSGKSALARCLRSMVDPRRPDLETLPRELRDLAVIAEHRHVIVFNNLSTIRAEMSDALCRLATGDGFSVRALYSDRDLATFDAARPIVLTSIADAATRPDLLDRALIVDLPERHDRLDEAELAARLDGARPRGLGALLYAIAHALGSGAAPHIPPTVRMRGPAAFAARAVVAFGMDPETVVSAYLTSGNDAADIVAEDPLVDVLLAWLMPGEPWEGTMATLLSTLTQRVGPRPPRGWPETPRGLSATLRRLSPTLRSRGVRYEPAAQDERRGHDRLRVHRLTRAQ